jgi:hypothetical protein
MWCVAELDEEYIGKMENVLQVYERSYNPAQPVICLDEKPVTLHADVRPASPAAPGKVAKRDNEYKRCGTANIFCAVEPKAGRHFTRAPPSGPRLNLLKPSTRSSAPIPCPELNIHCRKSLTDYFGPQQGGYLWSRLQVHYTPKHGSWLNQAEIELSLFSRQCLGRRRIPTLERLDRESRAWNRKMNRERVKIDWRFTRKSARQKFRYEAALFTRS